MNSGGPSHGHSTLRTCQALLLPGSLHNTDILYVQASKRVKFAKALRKGTVVRQKWWPTTKVSWGKELIQFLAALAILHRDDWKNRMGEFILFCKLFWCKMNKMFKFIITFRLWISSSSAVCDTPQFCCLRHATFLLFATRHSSAVCDTPQFCWEMKQSHSKARSQTWLKRISAVSILNFSCPPIPHSQYH